MKKLERGFRNTIVFALVIVMISISTVTASPISYTSQIEPATQYVSISGTISLPSGVTAPAGGIEGEVYIESQNGGESLSATFNIDEAQNSTSYSVNVPASDGSSSYKISYWLYFNNVGYFNEGYYSTLGTTGYDTATAVFVSAVNISGINLDLLPGNTIFGSIYLPNGAVAPPEGIEGKVNVSLQNGSENYETYLYIAPGDNSTTYTLNIPLGDTNSRYTLGYWIYNNGYGYIGEGYYSIGGTTDINSATPINLNQVGLSPLDLTILSGNTISGTVSLPVGLNAPVGGIDGGVLIEKQDGSKNYYASFSILAGTNSASYGIGLPVGDTNSGYRVSYWFYNDLTGYYGEGYYSATGTTDLPSATYVNISTGNATNTNMVLLATNNISGSVLLPTGVAPAGGIAGQVVITSTSGQNYYNDFLISAGSNSVVYTATVPAGNSSSDYKVSYLFTNNYSTYINHGYYSADGTKILDYATTVNISAGSLTGINLTLLKGNSISGTISLPNSFTAPVGGLEGGILITPQFSDDSYYQYFNIPEGGTSASYSITVPVQDPCTGYYTSYWFYNNYYGYLSEGYYSTTGTTIFDNATLTNVSSASASGKNLTLLTGNPAPTATQTPVATVTPSPTPTLAATPTPVLTLGDVNADGVINSVDALMVLQASSGRRIFTSNQNLAADVNRNGVVNSVDALMILQYSTGRRTYF